MKSTILHRATLLYRKDGSRRSTRGVSRLLWSEPEPVSTRIFLDSLRAGHTYAVACQDAALLPRVVDHWLKQAAKTDAKDSHIAFREDYMRALTTRDQEVASREARLPDDIALLNTPERIDRILEYMNMGTFPAVAAEACGVPAQAFLEWVEEGRIDPTSPHRRLYFAFLSCQATARANAEQRVHEDNPLAWLLHGPGRDRPDNPGWTRETRLTGPQGGPVTVITTQWGNARTVESSLEKPAET